MQWASASKSCGMPLSGAAMISEKTAEASLSRFIESSSLASSGAIASVASKVIRI